MGQWRRRTAVRGRPDLCRLATTCWLRGVAIFPDDVIVADRDGAVVIPAAMVSEIVDLAVEQERYEGWIIDEVRAGAALPGLYPPNEENRARYEAIKQSQNRK